MKLYLFRHGPAFPYGSPEYSEAKRSLTEEGKELTRQITLGMKSLDLGIELILTSPLIRAVQTAEIAAQTLGLEDKVQTCEPLCTGENQQLFKTLQKHKNLEGVCLVGHQPLMGMLISELVWGDNKIEIPLKKS